MTADREKAKPTTYELLTEKEAAQLLRLSVFTLRKWRWLGKGPKFAVLGDRAVRYRLSELQFFIDSSSYASTSEVTAAA